MGASFGDPVRFHGAGFLSLLGGIPGTWESVHFRVSLRGLRGQLLAPGSGVLGPKQRLQLGQTGGLAVIPAAPMPNTDSPVWLYDPAKGTSEFFLLEYRPAFVTNSTSLYDQNMHSNGLAIWFILKAAIGMAAKRHKRRKTKPLEKLIRTEFTHLPGEANRRTPG
ncbi:MAG: hypothetical protein NTW03_00355, partial [Verrucomicrobia bacterium]|nr:hypothetical protein [Verrucomicrobiota bacterium]